MGKALIVANKGEASYDIRIQYNREQVEREQAGIEQALEALAPEINEAEEKLGTLELEVEEVAITVNALIDDLEASGGPVSLTDLINRHNQERTSRGLSQLTGVGALHTAAQGHATWLAANNRSGHTGENGSSARDRITQAGYPWENAGAYGENVGVGLPDVEAAISAWLGSPGHGRNMLDPDWQHIGVGYACRSEGSYRHFWVVVFGRTESSVSAGQPIQDIVCEGSRDNVPESIREQMELLAATAKQRDIAHLQVAQLVARQLEMQLRLTAIAGIPDDPVQQAWCADFTDDLTGEVAVAVIPGEGLRAIVMPGYEGAAAWASARGQVMPRSAMTPAQAFFNAAVLPGWQRFKPTFRVGTLTAIERLANTGTVSLDTAQSSAQQLPVNLLATITAPFVYMQCDNEAFDVGDRVLVQFLEQSWDDPEIVGFESGPKMCPVEWPPLLFAIMPSTTDWDSSALQTVSDYVLAWSWFVVDGCGYWQATQIGSRQYNRTRDYSLLFHPLDGRVIIEESGEPVMYRRSDNGNTVSWHRLDEEQWTAASAPEDAPDWPTFDPLFTSQEKDHLNGQCAFNLITLPPDIPEATAGFAFRKWTWPDAVTGVGSPDGSCDNDPPVHTGLTVHAGEDFGQDWTSRPRPWPGWVSANNVRFDYPGSMTNPSYRWLAIEEDLFIQSTNTQEILTWLSTQTAAPASFVATRTVDDRELEAEYELVGVEWSGEPDSSILGRWLARYEVPE